MVSPWFSLLMIVSVFSTEINDSTQILCAIFSPFFSVEDISSSRKNAVETLVRKLHLRVYVIALNIKFYASFALFIPLLESFVNVHYHVYIIASNIIFYASFPLFIPLLESFVNVHYRVYIIALNIILYASIPLFIPLLQKFVNVHYRVYIIALNIISYASFTLYIPLLDKFVNVHYHVYINALNIIFYASFTLPGSQLLSTWNELGGVLSTIQVVGFLHPRFLFIHVFIA